MNEKFVPLLLGNDINTYSLARAFYEAYKMPSTVFCKTTHGPCGHSKICDVHTDPNMDLGEIAVPKVVEFAGLNADKKVILLGCGDNYVETIIKNKSKLPQNVVAPYIEPELMDKLIKKRDFYELAESTGLPYPQTFVYTHDMGELNKLPFSFPVVLKPSDGVLYWHCPFDTQKKVYTLNSIEEVNTVIEEIYKSGYTDALILQDTIQGDDSYMRVMTCLSGRDGKVKLMAMGHPLLEEHTPHGLGNTSIIMSDYDAELSEKIRNFLESINFVGMSNFDMKYDKRDGKIKVFEINVRQGRNNYYVTGGGHNVARYLVDEFIEHREKGLEIANVSSLWTVIPMGVAYRFVKDKKYEPILKEMVKDKKMKNPLFMPGDNSPKRMAYLMKSHYSHYVKYQKYYK